MTPEQLSWSDGQWAIYLDCPIQEIPSIRKFMTRNFFPLIERDVITGKYNFVMTRISTSMAGTKRIMPMVSDKETFLTYAEARKHANEVIIPKLELTNFWASAYYVPRRALQMLHIKER